MVTWQLFGAPHGIVVVPAESERIARHVLGKNHWSGVDPGWLWIGTAWLGWEMPERPPHADDGAHGAGADSGRGALRGGT